MAKLSVKPGSTDVTVYVDILDSTSTTGGHLSGLVYNSSGLTCYYTRTRGTSTSISLATLAAVDSAHSDGGFKEVNATQQKGVYRLDLPDAVCAAGARSAVVTLQGAANMVQVSLEIDLASEVDVTAWNGTAIPGVDTAGYPKVTIKDGTGAGEIDTNAGAIITVTNLTNAPTAGDFTATMKTSLNAATPASVTGAVGSVTGNVGGNVTGSVGSVVAPVTAGTVTDKTGYALTPPYDAAKTAAQAGDEMYLTAGAIDSIRTWLEQSTKLLRAITPGQNLVDVDADGALATQAVPVGKVLWTHSVKVHGTETPIAGALVLASSDAEGGVLLGIAISDLLGNATFILDPGTVYFRHMHTKWTFADDPEVEEVA